jgi:Proteasome assembly chaperone 4
MTSCDETADVMLMPCPKIQVMSFAVAVPAATTMDTVSFDDDFYLDDMDDPVGAAMQEMGITPKPKPKKKPKALCAVDPMEGIGMVGTITVLKTSILVWFGWGKTTTTTTTDHDATVTTTTTTTRDGVNHSRILGSIQGSKSTQMGHLIMAMPPRNYHGNHGTTAAESSTSKLIGSEFQDDETVAKQMACRLSQKCQFPVMVSCHVDPALSQQMGLDPDMVHARAAALVEQRIWELIKEGHFLDIKTTSNKQSPR